MLLQTDTTPQEDTETQETKAPPQPTLDVLTYAGYVTMAGYEAVTNALRSKKSDKALLVLSTPGGDPHAGFRIARALQHVYGSFDALIPRYCKSAGTLITLGASVLYLDDMSELGPLDIQIKKSDEVVGRNSGLDIIQAVNYLQNQGLAAFQSYLYGLTQDVGLSTKVASEIATKLTTGLFEPIAAQIDPMKLAEMQRATEIAFEYGSRLAKKSGNLRPHGLAKLVNGYPSHGFVIDRGEAKNIFIKVERPSGVLSELSDGLRAEMTDKAYREVAEVKLYTLPELYANPDEATSDAGCREGFATTGDPSICEHS